MSKADVAAYEKQVAKFCTSLADDVNKAIAAYRSHVSDQIGVLADNIKSLKVAKSMSDEELDQMPDIINKALKEKLAAIKNGSLDVKLLAEVDHDERKIVSYNFKYRGQALV